MLVPTPMICWQRGGGASRLFRDFRGVGCVVLHHSIQPPSPTFAFPIHVDEASNKSSS